VIAAIIEIILEWVSPAFRGSSGYAVIAAGVLLDRSAFTGLVVPGDIFLALGGIYAGRGSLSISAVIIVAAVAGLCGETIAFWLGRRFGLRLLHRLPMLNRLERYVERSEEFFRRHGGLAVFVGRYVSVAGTFIPFTAGMSRMSFPRFLAFDVLAISAWATAISLVGYFLNAQVEVVDRMLSRFGWGALAAIVLAVAGRYVYRHRGRIAAKIRSGLMRPGR
jgi:membrane-associated protein